MRSALLLLGVALLAGCANPVLDEERTALGGEAVGVPHGPTHRPGQPCTLCHAAGGGASPTFSVAGTLYQKASGKIPIEGASIDLTDALGATYHLKSNCVGTFYVEETTWTPTYPVRVQITDGTTTIKMLTQVSDEGVQPVASCSICHSDPASATSPGHLFLDRDPLIPDRAIPAQTCGRGGPGQ
ncbi:MAG: hypothetical protein ABJE95_08855 [Byssovorax sp.]